MTTIAKPSVGANTGSVVTWAVTFPILIIVIVAVIIVIIAVVFYIKKRYSGMCVLHSIRN